MSHSLHYLAAHGSAQRGGTIIGFILGLIVGLGAALGVAVYVAKVPVPFMEKGALRGPEQDAVEAEKNRQWNPNQGLAGKTPTVLAKPEDSSAAHAPEATLTPESPPAQAAASKPDTKPANTKEALKEAMKEAAKESTKELVKESTKESAKETAKESTKESTKDGKTAADPLGDFAKAKTTATAPTTGAGSDTFDYFVQAGAFRTQADADAQRAKLTMLGWEARVSEREQNGRPVFRVRVGPFAKRDDAEQLKGKLDDAGIDTNLVRVQR